MSLLYLLIIFNSPINGRQ